MNLFDVLFAKKLSGGGSPFPPVIKRVTGNPIEFEDGADAPLVKCVTEITGSQDLHGQDKPWVGGANVNKIDPDNLTAGYINGYNGNISPQTSALEYTSDYISLGNATVVTVGYNAFGSGEQIWVAVSWYDSNDTYIRRDDSINNFSHVTPPANAVKVRFSMRTYGHGLTNCFGALISTDTYSPYSNICPITAYTEGEIEVRGKNIFGTSVSSGYTITSLGVIESDPTRSATLEYTSIQGNIDYVLSYVGNMNNGVFFYDENKDFISFLAWGSTPRTFKSPSNAAYVRFSFNSATVPVNVMVEEGSVASTYEPYTSTTHTTTYPSAIYRGSEDVVKGEVTTPLKVVDMGDIPWVYNEQYNYFSANIYDLKKYANNVTPDMYCECYAVINSRYGSAMGGVGNGVICPRTDQSYIQVKETAYTDATQFKNSVTGMKLVYELATPTTSSVTPTNLPIKSLSGYNHIESSTGEMTIDYITDAYQNFVDTTERAVPSTRKGGVKAFDIFKTLDEPKKPEAPAEESEPEEKETEEGAKR